MRTRLHSFGRFYRDIAGSAAVEFAATAPVLILLLFGIVEAGRSLWATNSLQYAVERAARCGVVNSTITCPSDDAIKAYAVTQVYAQSISSDAFTVTRDSVNGAQRLCVAASWTFTPWFQSLTMMPSIALGRNSCRSVPPAS
jgi:Flp pilus assembly protein TadG